MQHHQCRFITLTRRHSHAPLADQIDALYEAFNKLRRRSAWKKNINGGAAFLEIKVSERTGLWHPHLHIIATGKYFPAHELSREWLAVTMDSSVVDIRAVTDAGHVAAYVTKYVTKPMSITLLQHPDKLDEALVAMRGRRLAMTFGTWRGIKLEDVEPGSEGWEKVGNIWHVQWGVMAGDPLYVAIYNSLKEAYPWLANTFADPPPPEILDPVPMS